MTSALRRGLITYQLSDAQRYPSTKVPATHQEQALSALNRWFQGQDAPRGGILVLPTGGGKTFTATRYLTQGPLSQGHKVLWLAHTHHLLDQAFAGFGRGPDQRYEVGHIRGSREQLTIRTVSGTTGHWKVADVKGSDDVVIITLQTLARAIGERVHAGLSAFLTGAAQSGLTVVFDECHHAPAPSFRRLIESLRAAVPNLHLLGLTATPTYTDVRRQGSLHTLFPQRLLYQVSPQDLMLAGVLARPIIEEPATHIQPNFSDQEHQAWSGSYRDIPEKVIAHLAGHQERNARIADTYVHNRERYGQTLIFADRWYQCTALVELLRQRGVRADAVFSHQDADPGSAEARNARSTDENESVLAQFRRGELDVLVNIRMLTEGTDVPNVKTVFLTRQTTSRILLTQMIGRALRGPKFGGTADAYVVAFIDDWKQHINWARWDDLVAGEVEEGTSALRPRLPVELVSQDLVAHLARQLDANAGPATLLPFLTLMPVGWYAVSYDAAVQDETAPDNIETVRQLIPVYSADQQAYEALFRELAQVRLDDFEDVTLDEAAQANLRGWAAGHFPPGERLTSLPDDLEAVVRHRARNGEWPTFTPFEAREHHDLDALAQDLGFERQLPRLAEDQALRAEFARADRLWNVLYRNYEQFKRQYDQSVNRLLHLQAHPEEVPEVGEVLEAAPLAEVPSALKKQVRAEQKVCQCCGVKRGLQVDHIRPQYLGGQHGLDNLQLLCGPCNRLKGTGVIDFRQRQTLLTSAAEVQAGADLIFRRTSERASGKIEQIVQRIVNLAYRCAAAERVQISKRGSAGPLCEVQLRPGNDPTWVQPLLNQALALWQRDVPEFGRVVAADIRAVGSTAPGVLPASPPTTP